MTHTRNAATSVGSMMFSAAIFGFFGFMLAWPERSMATNELIPLVLTLKWTVRLTAAAFLLSALVAMAQPYAGNLLYGVFGLASAAMLAVVVVWDFNSPYSPGIHWFLLLVFAVWNGYSSWAGLRECGVLGGPRYS